MRRSVFKQGRFGKWKSFLFHKNACDVGSTSCNQIRLNGTVHEGKLPILKKSKYDKNHLDRRSNVTRKITATMMRWWWTSFFRRRDASVMDLERLHGENERFKRLLYNKWNDKTQHFTHAPIHEVKFHIIATVELLHDRPSKSATTNAKTTRCQNNFDCNNHPLPDHGCHLPRSLRIVSSLLSVFSTALVCVMFVRKLNTSRSCCCVCFWGVGTKAMSSCCACAVALDWSLESSLTTNVFRVIRYYFYGKYK